MIIWKGYGILVVIIAAIFVASMSSIFTRLGANEEAGAAVGAIIAGIAIWFVGKRINAPEKARTYIDKRSGQEFIMKPDHSLFFIKMQYWAFIMGAIGCSVLISQLRGL